LPIRVADEPATTDQFIQEINDYVNGNLQILSHGIDRAANGTAFVFNSRFDDPALLTSGETYFIRFVTTDEIAVFENQADAEIVDDATALAQKIFVSATIASDDTHTITDAAFDPALQGNFLADVAMPRKSAVRRQGDDMEGTLFLSDHPGDLAGFGTPNGADDLQAASKFYVDNTSFSSTENIFVSLSGDDRMIGVPKGREGTALDFAFRTLNAAAERAEEMVRASVPEPGPYFQTVTAENGEIEATVTSADIVAPVFEQTRKLIDINKDYLEREYVGYLKYEFSDFIFNETEWREDLRIILDAVSFDINRGLNANTLARQAAERFYATTRGRFKIQSETEQVVDSINFVKESIDSILSNRLYRQRVVESVSVNGDRARVVTALDHGLTSGEQVVFKDMGGMVEIEGQTAYARVIDDTTFELYKNEELTTLFDISSYTDYTTGGRIGVVYQDRIQDFESIKLLQQFDQPDADATAQSAVASKFDLVLNIIQNGIDAGADIVFGENYKIVLNNGAQTYVDQANPDNLDMIPGKVIVGKQSGARGRIVKVTNNDGTENNNDSFELLQLNGKDFEIGESVEYGNFIRTKQITIFLESGIYEEDLPIKLSDNVSLKGDEFRRVIIRPKKRVSQSPNADMYFYRDLEFDGIEILETRHSEIDRVGFQTAETLEVDRTDWIGIGQEVKFVGTQLIGSEIDRESVYYVTSVTSGEITVSETPGGTNISFANNSGKMFVVDSAIAPFLNQVGDIQGYFGRHYLENPFATQNVGVIPSNEGSLNTAADILQQNRRYIQNEIIFYINDEIATANNANDTGSIWYQFSYDTQEYTQRVGQIIDGITRDLELGGSEFSLETQGVIFEEISTNEQAQTVDYIDRINFYTAQLLVGNKPPQNTAVEPDTSLGVADADSVSLVGNLTDLVAFAFNTNYNPPKRNDADGVDVLMMSDATIVRNVTVQGHAGFMVVLDPESQILTKSPYIQTGSSFSKSDNEKRFRGGMFVDAFVGNTPARITNIVTPFELELESDLGQGLFIRPPELPAPFYLEGVRYQVNAIANYDSGQGTVTILLDSGSNPDGSGIGQGYQGTTPQEIFIQTAGNRSMLGNDFTQINDLGYGLVTNNGAFSEMVSMFTYYCQAAYYANNGSEIRSLNGSNGYGFFGLVAEGADPNEIPDQVTLANPMAVPAKAYTTAQFPNSEEDPFITVYDLKSPPTANSIITIDHGASVGIFNYRISSVQNLSDSDSDGTIGDNAGDEVATGGVYSNAVYVLNIVADEAVSGDFPSSLQATVPDNTFIEYRNSRTQIFDDVRSPEDLETRPSTAINFDESDLVTYRSLEFATEDAFTIPLPSNQIKSLIELDYDFIGLEVDTANLGGGFGSSQGDTKLAIQVIDNPNRAGRLTRDIAGRQPGEVGYSGGMIFTFAGRTHQITNYDDSGSFAFIEFQDVANTNIDTAYAGSGLNTGMPARERTLFAGLYEGATAEITIAISLLRATGHDFLQIGTGGFNDSNYPNVLFGRPERQFAGPYTDASTATSSQIWERRKGRVFFVSTDQDGFFRVGKFFTVDQSTGSIEFKGEIGLTGANALGFTRGVTINEFSADDSFADLSNQAAPTERATGGYINRVLGYNVQSNSQIEPSPTGNRIGPGFVPLNGTSAMENDFNLGSNQITNLALPGSDGTAATNKNFVDAKAQAYDEFNDLRNIELNSVEANDLVVGTGKKRIFTTPVSGGTIEIGDTIGISGGFKTGTVVDIESYLDDIEGNLQIITYTETAGTFVVGETIFDQPGETANATIVDGPVDEFANARESTSSVINLSVTRNASETEFNLQIQDDSITNADVNSAAAISQSKLAMQKADTFGEANTTTGWDGTASKVQADLGLAKFSDENFDTKEGFVRIKANGVVFAEIQQIPEDTVIGRSVSGTGDVSAIPFSSIITQGGGLRDQDFTNTVVSGNTGFPGNALVQLESGVYGITEISTATGGDTIARRDSAGSIDASSIKVGGFDILTLQSSTIRFNTPGGARVFTAAGNTSDSLVTKFPGSIDVGETTITTESNFQSGSNYAGEGFIASDWIYTSFIEAATERGTGSTGIGIGSGAGFTNSVADKIDFITSGAERVVISDNGLDVFGNTSVSGALSVSGNTSINGSTDIGDNSGDTVTLNASVDSNILPDQNGVRNIGSNSLRWDVEVTVTEIKGDSRAAGVVSANPAYLMNSDLKENAVAVALQGRVPCKVLGKVKKGDMIVSSAIPGYGIVNNEPSIGTVIGKALEDKTDDAKGEIEIVVGRT